MSINILMIILTMLDGGQMSAAFVNTASEEECGRRAAMVRTVLEAADTPIKQIVCRESTAMLSRYTHNIPADASRQQYLIRFDQRQASVTALPASQACDPAPTKGAEGMSSYCATSTQSLLPAASSGTQP